MVIKRTPNGTEYEEPPYTAEGRVYRRMSGGPVTVVKPAPTIAQPQKPKPLGK
jgi:hypothetical protein